MNLLKAMPIVVPMFGVVLLVSCDGRSSQEVARPPGGVSSPAIAREADPPVRRQASLARVAARDDRASGAVNKDRYVLLKAVEERDESPAKSFRGILAREIGRQAFLIAAREGRGLIARDEMLGESVPSDEPSATFVIHAEPVGKGLQLKVSRVGMAADGPSWERVLPMGGGSIVEYKKLVEAAEKVSREDLPDYLRRVGLGNEPRAARGGARVAPASAERLAAMNFADQYAAIRDLHETLRTDGESPELLGALTRGYANLGSHTEFFWHPMTNAFQARALLYAQRLGFLDPKSPAWPWHRAYASAMIGAHRSALDDLAEAQKRLEVNPTAPGPPPDGSTTPGWVDLIGSFCRFDTAALADPRAGKALAPLADWLRFLAVEDSRVSILMDRTGLEVLKANPEAYRVYDTLCGYSQLNVQHRVTAANMQVLSATLPDRLRPMSGLPVAVGDLIGKGADEGALTGALIEAGRADPSPAPSWAVLGRMIRELRFTQVQRRLQFMRFRWSVPVDDFLVEARPLVADHPYRGFLESYGIDGTLDPKAHAEAIRGVAIDAAGVELTADRLLFDLQGIGVREPLQRALHHVDHVSNDLARLFLDINEERRKVICHLILQVSPHSPFAMTRLIESDWENVRDHAGEWEKAGAQHPWILGALGIRFSELSRWDDAERCLRACILLSPDDWVYQRLARNYRSQGRLDKWKETLDDYLKLEAHGLEQARVRVELARHLMELGQWEEAKPYAEAAAATWASWAMLCAADCAEGMGDWGRAEFWIRQYAERYDGQVDWYFWCKRTGHGDVETAGRLVEERFREQIKNGQSVNLWVVGITEILGDRPRRAIETLKTSYAKTGFLGEGFLLALLADELGDRPLSEKTWASVAAKGKEIEAAAPMGRLADLFLQALKRGDGGGLDLAAVDALIESSSGGLPGDLPYYVGRFLELHGRGEESIAYFRRCAGSSVGFPQILTLAIRALRNRGEGPGPGAETP